MAKIIFRAEARIPRQIILPLLVASTAQVPRVLTLDSRKMDVHEAVAEHLEQRYPKWLEVQPQEPEQTELEKLTIAELKEMAATEGIDLGRAKLHAEIVKVIVDHQASAEDDEFGSDGDAQSDPDADADGDESAEQEADDAPAEGSDA